MDTKICGGFFATLGIAESTGLKREYLYLFEDM
jgi:hypothetical protein